MQAAGRVYLASMGIYIFNAAVLKDMLDSRPEDHDFGKTIIPEAIQQRHVVSYPFEGYWSDIGTIRSFYEANLMLAQPEPAFNLYDPVMPLYTNARMLAPAKVENSAVRNAIISEGSVIVGAEITDSVIGLRSFVGRGSTIRRSVLMGSDYYPWHDTQVREPVQGPTRPGIGTNTHIENAIIDRNASVGNDCAITNRDGVDEGEGPGFYIRDGIVVIEKNAEIYDGTVI